MREPESELCTRLPASGPGVYVYCFARDTVADRIETTGIDDADVTALAVEGIAAVYSPVPVGTFSGPSGDANLRNVAWIAPRARRHERVVEEVMRFSPVLPVRFGTVFSSTSALEGTVAANAGPIGLFLARMADLEEWSVKAFLDMPKAEAWLVASQTAVDETTEPGPVSPGLRYIQGRQLRVGARRRLQDLGRQTAGEVERLLAAHAVDICPLRLQDREASWQDRQMVLNCAQLVLKDRVAAWRDHAIEIEARYAERGLSLNICGPWPPYSFCPSLLDGEQSR
jgi:hypothetical protein